MVISKSTFLMFVVLMFIVPIADGQVMEKGTDDLKVVVEFVSADATDMNFNVDQPIIYNIELINNLSCSMRYKIELEVGSDVNDPSITRKYVQDISLPARSSEMAKFDVYFRSRELCQGEFYAWAANDSKTDIWERAWYRIKVAPLVGDPVCVESPPRQPPLIHVSTIYEGADVSPRMGTNKTLYDYQLKVFSSVEDAITLLVAPAKTGPWTKLETKNYTESGTWQTLNWDEVPLNFEFDFAYYKFEGRKSLGPIAGPSWSLEYFNFRNAEVTPDEGFPDSAFTYNLDVNSSNIIDVDLWVRDLDKGTENFAGKKSYTNIYGWETLEWSGVKTGEIVGSKGSPSYYFKFYRRGANGAFNHSSDCDGYYMGPDLVLVKFENLTVRPDNVSSFVPHSYCVEVDTSLETCDIELQTSNPDSSIWLSQGTKTWKKDMGRKICWDNVTLGGHSSGTVMCRFVPTETVPKEQPGPEFSAQDAPTSINVKMEQNGQAEQPIEEINSSLKTDFYRFKDPKVSPIKGTNQINYQYQIDLISSNRDTVSLKVSNSIEGPWFEVGSREYTTPGIIQTLIWSNVKLNFDFEKGYYKFEGREEFGPQEGPFWPIDYNYLDEKVEPIEGDLDAPFVYSLKFNASKPVDVDLNVWDLDKKKFRSIGKKNYKNATEQETLIWPEVRPSKRSEGASFYYFSIYEVGAKEPLYETKEFFGPNIIDDTLDDHLIFKKSNVSPERGSIISRYDYYLEPDSKFPNCDVELQTCEGNSSVWKSRGIATYKNGKNDQNVHWDDITLENTGTASYRFVCGNSISNTHIGPEIMPIKISGDVYPHNGSINDSYLYSAEIDSEGSHPPVWIKLEIYHPIYDSWISINQQLYEQDREKLNFSVRTLPISDVSLDELKYRFVMENIVLGTFKGPYIYREIYRNQSVYPSEGSNKTLYDYQIEVLCNRKYNITLQVAPSDIGPWVNCESRDYSTPNQWQTLKWDDLVLDFDFDVARYRFSGLENSKTFEGPFWHTGCNYRNENVKPINGYIGMPFTYSLNLNSTKPLEIGLNIWDLDNEQFRLIEKKSYNKTYNWETITWTNVEPSQKIAGRSSYYFNLYENGSNEPFKSTEEFFGPNISYAGLVTLGNATVTPNNGSMSIPYTYSVGVNAGLPSCDLELQTREPGSRIWKSRGFITYDGGTNISWDNVTFDCDHWGMVGYRVLCTGSSAVIYGEGPTLIKTCVVGNVTPASGVLQAFPDINNLYEFTYTAQFDENTDANEELWVDLLVRAPNSVWKTVGDRKQCDPSKGYVSWVVKPFYEFEFLGIAEYKFLINGVESDTFEGPEILAEYRSLDYEELGSGRYNYIARINGSVNMTIDLQHSTDNVNWVPLKDVKRYVANTGWQKLVWNNKPGYAKYEVDIKFDEVIKSQS